MARPFPSLAPAALLLCSLGLGLGLAPAASAAPTAHRRPKLVATDNASLVSAVDRDPRDADWRYIVLHHTAAETDSLAGISRGHARRFCDPLGIQYHFLIGNGRSAPDGAIQLARWRYRAQSIHVVHPERAPNAITVSLQGNLHARAPSPAQLLAVETLVRRLMQVYAIPVERISTNTRVDGTFTVCPGRYFPIDRLLYRLQHAATVTSGDWRDPLAAVPLVGPLADLDTVRASLLWDRPCKERIPVGPLVTLQTLNDSTSGLQALLLGVDGGRGCTPIKRRLLALHTAAGWYTRELNGYRVSKLKLLRPAGGVAVQVGDERGPMQTCAVPAGAEPRCALVRPRR